MELMERTFGTGRIFRMERIIGMDQIIGMEQISGMERILLLKTQFLGLSLTCIDLYVSDQFFLDWIFWIVVKPSYFKLYI